MDHHLVNGKPYYKIGQVKVLLELDEKKITLLVKTKRLSVYQERPFADRFFPKDEVDRIKSFLDKKRVSVN